MLKNINFYFFVLDIAFCIDMTKNILYIVFLYPLFYLLLYVWHMCGIFVVLCLVYVWLFLVYVCYMFKYDWYVLQI